MLNEWFSTVLRELSNLVDIEDKNEEQIHRQKVLMEWLQNEINQEVRTWESTEN